MKKRPREHRGAFYFWLDWTRPSPGNSLVVVVGQERRRELGRGAVVVAAFAIPARAAVATVSASFTPRATRATVVAIATVAARAAITVATAMAATVATVTARATVTALARLARRAVVRKLFAGLLVDEAHRQADLAALVDLEQLDLHFLAFGEDVADVLDPLVLDLRHVHQAVLAGHEGHERAEIEKDRKSVV